MAVGNQRYSLMPSILQLISVQLLLLTLSADCQSYSNYGAPYLSSGSPYNPLYSPPAPLPMSYSSSYGPSVYGIQSSHPGYQPNYSPATYQPNYSPATYQPNYTPALSSCLSYYCYRSALPLTAGSTTTAAPPAPTTTSGPCGNRNFLVCVADNLASTALAVVASPYQQYQQYQTYQKYNVCPAYFCRVVTTTTPAPPATAAPDACDSFECEIVE